MSKYTLGIDYGSLSGRTVLVRCDTGEVVAESTLDYPHAVMDTALPDGTLFDKDGKEYSYLFSRNRPNGPGTRVYIRASANP